MVWEPLLTAPSVAAAQQGKFGITMTERSDVAGKESHCSAAHQSANWSNPLNLGNSEIVITVTQSMEHNAIFSV